jgi:hypothetical protein
VGNPSTARDISLLIRARTEGERAIDTMAKALDGLFAGQDKVKGSAVGMAAALATADKAFATIIGAVDKGAAAYERQSAALQNSKTEYAAVKAQIDAAAAAIENLNAKQNQIGPQQGGPGKIAADLKAATAGYTLLTAQADRLSASIAEARRSGRRRALSPPAARQHRDRCRRDQGAPDGDY